MKKIILFLLIISSFAVKGQIVGTTQVCVGGNYTYTDAHFAGAITYRWILNNTIDAYINSVSGVLSVIKNRYISKDSIYFIYQPTPGVFDTDKYNFIPNPIVGPIYANHNPICFTGSPITIIDSGAGYFTSSDTTIATVNNCLCSPPYAVVTAVRGGTVTLTFTPATTGCGIANPTLSFRIDTNLSPITYAPKDSLCINTNIQMSEYPKGGYWSTFNGSIASINFSTGLVTGNAQGITAVSYRLTNTCGVLLNTQNVYVFQPAAPIIGPINISTSSNVTYSDITPGGIWTISGGSSTIGSSSGTVTASATQELSDVITYTVTNKCGVTAVTTPIYVYAANHMDSCHWKGSATPVPCPDFRPWKTTRDDQIDITNNLLAGILTASVTVVVPGTLVVTDTATRAMDSMMRLPLTQVGLTKIISLTPALSAGAYQPNYVIGQILNFHLMRTNNGTGQLMSFMVRDTMINNYDSLTIYLFSEKPINGSYTNNTLFSFNATDFTYLQSVIQVNVNTTNRIMPGYYETAIIPAINLPIQTTGGGDSIYAIVVSNNWHNIYTQGALTFTLGVLQD